ncbi:MAG: hypothetical protein GXN98_05230 [Euryarchaeota archaeon]|nr:hypothetical protein [Euryarchaeota archaeon]
MLLNLRLTMESGQPPEFLWQKQGSRYFRMLDTRAELWQDGSVLRYRGCSGEYVHRLLRLEDRLEEVYEVLCRDEALARAVRRFRGLRLTLSEPWETLVAFLCSINNNIPRIKRNVQAIMSLAGGRMPAPEVLAEAELKHARLGFRERFIKRSAELVAEGALEGIERLEFQEAKRELMRLPGVGEKVAECVLLFGYGFLEAFPVDVWIARAMQEYFGVSRSRIESFSARWEPYQGYAQQYLYLLAREELKP